VVEAIFEDKDVKQALFKELDGICGAGTILATNTSSFFVDDVAEACEKHPERVCGLHYFYHPAKNRLVEVIAGKKTDESTFAHAWALQEMSGKTPIKSADAPGFIVNRFFVPWLNESMRLVEEGVANIATVEAAAKEAFGVGMGPFQLMNVTGVPITLHAATTLGEQLGDFYKPCDLIRPQVEKKEDWNLEGDVDESAKKAVIDRLYGVVFQIATTLVFDEKVCTLEDCDLGARVGLRWPKGPFEMMNALGTEHAFGRVVELSKTYNDVKVPAAIAEHGNAKKPFAIQLVTHRVESDGTGWLTINRPDAMNALSEPVMEQIEQGFDALLADEACKGIIIEGKGKAFVAGADVRYFVEQIEADNVDRIVAYAKGGQQVFRKIDTSAKPVVCKLHGLSLGGGSELALACDHIVATPKGTMGFPETGIGIYPGLGGTQRSARRVGVALARWLVLTGQVLDAKTALGLGLLDQVASPSELDEALRKRALSQVAQEQSPPTDVPAGYEALAKVFEAPLADLLEGKVELPEGAEGEQIAKSLKKLGHKAPIALQVADELVRATADNSLADGLTAESDQLDRIFRTADALEGMRSVGRRRPSFTGA
jgi:enoyl-CoA hydratase/3-hydroxyacyl-CoA dehydrogenase